MSEYTLFFQRLGLVGTREILFNIKSLILLSILTKSLNTNDYGIWTQILITIAFFQPFIQLGLGGATTRYLSSQDRMRISQGIFTVVTVVIIVGSLASTALFLLSDSFAALLLNDASIGYWVRLFIPVIVLEATIAMFINSFRILNAIKLQTIILIIQSILEIALVGLALFAGFGLLGATFALIGVRIIVLAITVYVFISLSGFAAPKFSLLRNYLSFGIPTVPSSFFKSALTMSDRYVVGYYFGAIAVGIYSATYNIANLPSIIGPLLTYILFPEIFRLYDRGESAKVKMYLEYSWKYLLMILIPAVFGLAVLAGPVVELLTTPEYVQIGRAVIPIVALSTLFNGVFGIFTGIVFFTKNTKIFPVIYGVSALLNIALNILLIPVFGIVTAAYTTLVAYMLLAYLFYIRSKSVQRFDLNFTFIMKSVIASGGMSVILFLINPQSLYQIAGSVVLGVCLYFIFLKLVGGITIDEIKSVKNVVLPQD